MKIFKYYHNNIFQKRDQKTDRINTLSKETTLPKTEQSQQNVPKQIEQTNTEQTQKESQDFLKNTTKIQRIVQQIKKGTLDEPSKSWLNDHSSGIIKELQNKQALALSTDEVSLLKYYQSNLKEVEEINNILETRKLEIRNVEENKILNESAQSIDPIKTLEKLGIK